MEFPDMLDHHDKEIKRLCKNKNALEEIEKNKKTIRLEYQRGFADGGKDMNEKWLITRQGLIGEFLTDLSDLIDDTQQTKSIFQLLQDLKDIKKKWEDKTIE